MPPIPAELPSAEALAGLSGDRLAEIYRLSDHVPDDTVRAALKETMRSRLRVDRPPRRRTALRLFCTPFEDLLCDRPGRLRRPFHIPRQAILPLWALVRRHAPAGSLGSNCHDPAHDPAEALKVAEAGLDAVIQRAKDDRMFAETHGSCVAHFWDIVVEIQGTLALRDRVGAVRTMQAEAAAGRLDLGTAAADLDRAILALVPEGRWKIELFLILLIKHKATAMPTLDALERLCAQPDSSLTADRLDLVYDTAIGELRSRAAAIPGDDTDEFDPNEALDAIEPTARNLAALKGSAASLLPANAARIEQLETELRVTLEHKVVGRIEARAERLALGLSRPVRRTPAKAAAFRADIAALARTQDLFVALGRLGTWQRKVDNLRGAVSNQLIRAAEARADDEPGEKQALLRDIVDTIHALEQVCLPSKLLPVLRDCFAKLQDPGVHGFFVTFLDHMNEDASGGRLAP